MRLFSPEEEKDIRELYRGAKDQLAQIGILAQLYACSKEEIKAVLWPPESRVDPAPAPDPRRKKYQKYTAEFREAALARADEIGTSATERELGLSSGLIGSWRRAAKRGRQGRTYTAEARQEAVARILKGQPVPDTEKALGIPAPTLRRWAKEERGREDAGGEADGAAAEAPPQEAPPVEKTQEPRAEEEPAAGGLPAAAEEQEEAGDGPKAAAAVLPAATEGEQRAQRVQGILDGYRAAVEGLALFTGVFATTEVIGAEDWQRLDLLRGRAVGFVAGLRTAFELRRAPYFKDREEEAG